MKVIILFIVIALCGVVTGCSSSVDPKQYNAAVKLCGREDFTAYITTYYNIENSRFIDSVTCIDGAKYNTHITAQARKLIVYK